MINNGIFGDRLPRTLLSVALFLQLFPPALQMNVAEEAGVEKGESAKFNRILRIGDPAPDWKDLPDTTGQKTNLSDFKQQPIVVLFFTRNHCPISRKYAVRIRQVSRQFDSEKVAFIAINSSQRPGEDFERMQKVRSDAGWEFPYLKDETGKLAECYGASVTPQFFILDRQRKIAYMGAFDDHQDPQKVQEPYLKWGIEQALEGKRVEIPESLPIGCPIREPEIDK